MTLHEFCKTKTQAKELCVIKDAGWIIATAWIDYEDLFVISDELCGRDVKKDYWDELPVVTEHGDSLKVPCHVIEI